MEYLWDHLEEFLIWRSFVSCFRILVTIFFFNFPVLFSISFTFCTIISQYCKWLTIVSLLKNFNFWFIYPIFHYTFHLGANFYVCQMSLNWHQILSCLARAGISLKHIWRIPFSKEFVYFLNGPNDPT